MNTSCKKQFAGAVLALASLGAANAAVVTWTFTGLVTNAFNSVTGLSDASAVGNVVTGSIAFDPSLNNQYAVLTDGATFYNSASVYAAGPNGDPVSGYPPYGNPHPIVAFATDGVYSSTIDNNPVTTEGVYNASTNGYVVVSARGSDGFANSFVDIYTFAGNGTFSASAASFGTPFRWESNGAGWFGILSDGKVGTEQFLLTSLKVTSDLSPPPIMSSVPEPGTYATTLAGLSLIGLTLRRRKIKTLIA